MLKEFRDFVMRGNVIDLAVGVIIGAAFGKIVNSLVEDIITPLLLMPILEKGGAKNIESWSINGVLLGKFIAALISFLLIAFVLFLMIKAINKAIKKKEATPAPPAGPTKEEQLLTEIRDLLKRQ